MPCAACTVPAAARCAAGAAGARAVPAGVVMRGFVRSAGRRVLRGPVERRARVTDMEHSDSQASLRQEEKGGVGIRPALGPRGR